jgi:hypothetical protein
MPKGSQYTLIAVEKDGNYLEGRQTYRLNIPKVVPSKDF